MERNRKREMRRGKGSFKKERMGYGKMEKRRMGRVGGEEQVGKKRRHGVVYRGLFHRRHVYSSVPFPLRLLTFPPIRGSNIVKPTVSVTSKVQQYQLLYLRVCICVSTYVGN